MNIHEMREGVDYVSAILRQIHEDADGAELDDEAQTRFDEGAEYIESTRSAIEAYEAREAVMARGAEVRDKLEAGTVKREAPNFQRSTTRDVFDLGTVDRSSERAYESELRDRALEVIERHVPKWVDAEKRESAEALIEKRKSTQFDAQAVRSHIVQTSSPAYVRAFEDYMANPEMGVPAELRAAMSLTAANGGVMVPQFLDPTIVLTNTGAENDVRNYARIESITVDQWDGVTSAGVTAEWLGEGTEAADATPTFVGPTITAHKEAAYLFASYEVLADSGFDQVGALVMDAFDRLEETACATGTGSSQPYGLVTRLSGTGPSLAGSSGAAGAADLVVADIYALDENLGPRWRKNATFLAHRSIYNDVRQLNTNAAGSTFWVDLGGGIPAELIGYKTALNNAMDSTVVSGSNDDVLLLGDLKQYVIVDRVGTSIMYNPLVIGSNQRPTGQAGWFAFKRTGADVLTSNAFKLLRL